MEDLTPDCLSHIFLNLDFIDRVRLEQVCRQWYNVLHRRYTYSDMRKLNIAHFLMTNSDAIYQQEGLNFVPTILGVMERCGPYVRQLTFGQIWLRASKQIIDCITRNCRRLQILNIGATILTVDINDLLYEVSSQLVEFSLEETSWTDSWHAFYVQDHFHRMKNLRKINLRLAQFPLEQLYTLPECLEEIDLSCVTRLESEHLCKFLEVHPNLRVLNLMNTSCVNNQVLEAISKCKLEILSLGHIDLPLDYETVMLRLTNLREIRLQALKHLNAAAIHNLMTNAVDLTNLSIIECPSILDYSSLNFGRQLQSVEICGTRQLCNNNFYVLATFSKLKKLNVSDCMNLSSRGVTSILMRCQLTELCINFCKEMADEVMYTVASTQRELEKIAIQGCTNITSKGVCALAWLRNIHLLKEADVSRNRNVNDAVVTSLHNALTMSKMTREKKAADECGDDSQYREDETKRRAWENEGRSASADREKDQRLAMYIFNTSIHPEIRHQVKDLIVTF